MGGNALEALIRKVDEVKITCIETKDAVQALRDIVNKNNGRLGNLEQKNEKFIADHARYSERLDTHMKTDEVEQKELEHDVKGITKKVFWVAGAAAGAGAIVPYLISGVL